MVLARPICADLYDLKRELKNGADERVTVEVLLRGADVFEGLVPLIVENRRGAESQPSTGNVGTAIIHLERVEFDDCEHGSVIIRVGGFLSYSFDGAAVSDDGIYDMWLYSGDERVPACLGKLNADRVEFLFSGRGQRCTLQLAGKQVEIFRVA